MPFREGLTKVKLNGEEFYIDKNGNRIEEKSCRARHTTERMWGLESLTANSNGNIHFSVVDLRHATAEQSECWMASLTANILG